MSIRNAMSAGHDGQRNNKEDFYTLTFSCCWEIGGHDYQYGMCIIMRGAVRMDKYGEMRNE